MSEPEIWLRGPVAGVPPILQPVAHSLLQCQQEVRVALNMATNAELSSATGSAASAAFHLRHAAGSLDRLLTYARGEELSATQLAALRSEQDAPSPEGLADSLRGEFDSAIGRALMQIRSTDVNGLLEPRAVGRARLPSTVLGLLFHAAEHTQRHVGQLVTTLKILRGTAS